MIGKKWIIQAFYIIIWVFYVITTLFGPYCETLLSCFYNILLVLYMAYCHVTIVNSPLFNKKGPGAQS